MFVTHDQDEAFVLGDQVAVMRDGLVVQQASPAELYRNPVDPWLAEFVGEAELLAGVARGDRADTSLGVVGLVDERTGPVRVLIRPEEILLSNGTGGVVTGVEYYGHDALSTVRLDDGTVVRSRVTGAPAHRVGDAVAVGHRGAPTVSYLPATV